MSSEYLTHIRPHALTHIRIFWMAESLPALTCLPPGRRFGRPVGCDTLPWQGGS